MNLADHVAALVEGIDREQLACMRPAVRERFMAQLRRLLVEAARIELDERQPLAGVLSELNQGGRSE